MAQDKKYISLTRLQEYNTKLKDVIDQKNSDTLQNAKEYADSLGANYDAAGTAATKVKELADGQVKTNTNEINSLKSSKANKSTTLSGYGITNAYTKDETSNLVKTEIGKAGHLKREIVTTLPSPETADEHTIYMVPKSSKLASNEYDEYMLVNKSGVKTLEKIGDSAVDLTNYATKEYVDTAKQAAISAASADATSKANKALADAKTYADGLGKNYATAAQGAKADSAVQGSDVKTGTENGSISVKGTNVPVKGLGSAAYTESSAYEKAGAVTALANGQVATNKKSIEDLKGKVSSLEESALTEATTEDIDAMFS